MPAEYLLICSSVPFKLDQKIFLNVHDIYCFQNISIIYQYRNPNIFYVYEPLDAAYSALYGVAPGWSVPSDITGNEDGSVRWMTLP